MENISKRDKKIYAIISVFIVILIFITFLVSSNELFQAYVNDKVLTNGWNEDGKGYYESRLLGLEKQASFNYINDNKTYPASLTVSSFKTLFMISEKELIEKTIQTIESNMKKMNIFIDKDSEKQGQRVLNNRHRTNYVVFNASKMINDTNEKIKIIGEAWNCEKSGSSIITIGFAQTTNKSVYFPEEIYVEDFSHFAKIIKDPGNTFGFYLDSPEYVFLGDDGLIFNIICH